METVIVGCGMSGILTGLKLKEQGLNDFVILEKEPDAGGTWNKSRQYPGMCCDVQAAAYLPLQYLPGFVPSRLYASGAEIQDCLEQIAAKYGLFEKIKFQRKVFRARYDEKANRWTVETTNLETHVTETYDCKFVIFANGPLSKPRKPEFVGLDTFKGKCCHSSSWTLNLEKDVKGKRCGIIGTGASAIQIIPELAKYAKDLYVFQRSPPYCWPRNDGPIPNQLRDGLLEGGLPFVEQTRANFNSFADDTIYELFHDPVGSKEWVKTYRKHLAKAVHDSDTVELLMPDYPPGCKRGLISDEYLQTFNRPNVHLIHDRNGVVEIEGNTIVTASGKRVDVDVLVCANGFYTGPIPDIEIIGKTGESLNNNIQREGTHSAFGLVVRGFPNMFTMLAPQSWTAHGNTSEAIDIQSNWVVHVIQTMGTHQLETVEPTVEAEKWWVGLCTKFGKETVWANCGRTWYVPDGANPILWTGRWDSFVNFLRTRTNESLEFTSKTGAIQGGDILGEFHVSLAQLPQKARL